MMALTDVGNEIMIPPDNEIMALFVDNEMIAFPDIGIEIGAFPGVGV